MIKSYRTLTGIFFAALISMYPFFAAADSYGDAVKQLRAGSYQQARSQMRALAEQGHAGAQFQLGLMAHLGRGVPQNFEAALKWYARAAAAGDVRSQNNLGVIYRDGLGIPPDPVLAYKWFSLAASKRNVQAVANLRGLVHGLSKAEILRGQKLAQLYHGELSMRRGKIASARPNAAPIPARPETPGRMQPAANAAPGTTKNENSILAALKAMVAPLGARQSELVEKEPKALGEQVKQGGKQGEFLVQLGLFRKQSNVHRIRAALKSRGIKVIAEKINYGGHGYNRLRVGPYANGREAKTMAALMNKVLGVRSFVLYQGPSDQAEAAKRQRDHL